jgi:hypothetical protein
VETSTFPYGTVPYPRRRTRRSLGMVDLWLHDLESLEALTQDEQTKRLCLRMAAMSQAGTLEPFIATLRLDDGLDETTRRAITEIAANESFLAALEDYVQRTRVLH